MQGVYSIILTLLADLLQLGRTMYWAVFIYVFCANFFFLVCRIAPFCQTLLVAKFKHLPLLLFLSFEAYDTLFCTILKRSRLLRWHQAALPLPSLYPKRPSASSSYSALR